MAKLFNLAGMSTATTGTGTITLGSALYGHLTFAQAGVADGEPVTYAIKDGASSEIGRGVYTSSGTTLTRTVLKSTNSDAAINLSGAAEVVITAAAEDFVDTRRNRLANPVMAVAQRGASFTSATTPANNDASYLLDRWKLLSDGNDIVDVTQSTEAPAGGINSIALDVETVNKKFGICQPVERAICADLIGGNVVFSFYAKVSATTKLDNIKAAIIAWDGTADTITSDIISAWGVEGTNPTLVANCTYENTPANLNVTTSWARYSITANVDTASTKNIIVMIWSDVTDTTAGDFLYVTNCALEYGTEPTRFERPSPVADLQMCQRYLPAYRNVGGSLEGLPNVAQSYNTTTGVAWIAPFPAPPRSPPTGIVTGDASKFRFSDVGGQCFGATVTFITGSPNASQINFTTNSAATTNVASGTHVTVGLIAGGFIYWTGCEL